MNQWSPGGRAEGWQGGIVQDQQKISETDRYVDYLEYGGGFMNVYTHPKLLNCTAYRILIIPQ